ncbi:hypothetical protein HMPREF3189_00375 [Clostridiales bacterium KA00134]|nr:hypothetical protein HMPREF3189_00375 [Clostridiales bacterium KA00134]
MKRKTSLGSLYYYKFIYFYYADNVLLNYFIEEKVMLHKTTIKTLTSGQHLTDKIKF